MTKKEFPLSFIEPLIFIFHHINHNLYSTRLYNTRLYPNRNIWFRTL